MVAPSQDVRFVLSDVTQSTFEWTQPFEWGFLFLTWVWGFFALKRLNPPNFPFLLGFGASFPFLIRLHPVASRFDA